MSVEPGPARPGEGAEYVPTDSRSARWAGLPIFAALMLMLVGGSNLISGVAALVKDEVAAADPLALSVTAWGWLMIVFGAVIIFAGIGVLAGQRWANGVGVVVAGLNALAHIALVPSYPVRSLVVIALDVLVIYALTAHGRELRA